MSGDRDAMDQLCRLLRRATREGWDGITIYEHGRVALYARDAHQVLPDAQCTALRAAIERRIHQRGLSDQP